MSAHPQYKRLYTVEEYFELEEKSDIKHEYYRGEIFAMAGGSANHSRIAGNVFAACHFGLRGSKCEAFTSDIRVLIAAFGFYTYPDITVTCGATQFAENQTDTIINPIVVIEVLSPSTKNYDRGQKFQFYRSIPTLKEYVVIEQDFPYIEYHFRQEKTWILTEIKSIEDTLSLQSIDIQIPLRDLYARVDWLPVA